MNSIPSPQFVAIEQEKQNLLLRWKNGDIQPEDFQKPWALWLHESLASENPHWISKWQASTWIALMQHGHWTVLQESQNLVHRASQRHDSYSVWDAFLCFMGSKTDTMDSNDETLEQWLHDWLQNAQIPATTRSHSLEKMYLSHLQFLSLNNTSQPLSNHVTHWDRFARRFENLLHPLMTSNQTQRMAWQWFLDRQKKSWWLHTDRWTDIERHFFSLKIAANPHTSHLWMQHYSIQKSPQEEIHPQDLSTQSDSRTTDSCPSMKSIEGFISMISSSTHEYSQTEFRKDWIDWYGQQCHRLQKPVTLDLGQVKSLNSALSQYILTNQTSSFNVFPWHGSFRWTLKTSLSFEDQAWKAWSQEFDTTSSSSQKSPSCPISIQWSKSWIHPVVLFSGLEKMNQELKTMTSAHPDYQKIFNQRQRSLEGIDQLIQNAHENRSVLEQKMPPADLDLWFDIVEKLQKNPCTKDFQAYFDKKWLIQEQCLMEAKDFYFFMLLERIGNHSMPFEISKVHRLAPSSTEEWSRFYQSMKALQMDLWVEKKWQHISKARTDLKPTLEAFKAGWESGQLLKHAQDATPGFSLDCDDSYPQPEVKPKIRL